MSDFIVENGKAAFLVADRNMVIFESGRLYEFIDGVDSDSVKIRLVASDPPFEFSSLHPDERSSMYGFLGQAAVLKTNDPDVFDWEY